MPARPSNNLIIAGEQALTRDWWEQRKHLYRLLISQAVIEEMSCGDPQAAQLRLDSVDGIEELSIDEQVISLTAEILTSNLISQKAAADAIHIAVASRHGVDYLLTWNCKHIANAEIIRQISYIIGNQGYFVPIICTPRELFGGQDDE